MTAQRSINNLIMQSDASMMWVGLVIGAVSLFFYFSKSRDRRQQQRGPVVQGSPTQHPTTGDLRSALRDEKYRGWKILVDADILLDADKKVVETEAKSILKLCQTADVFVMMKSRREDVTDAKRSLASLRHLIPANKFLFCETEKGLEAFTRQLLPTLLITRRSELSTFLAKFLPFVLLVGGRADAANITAADRLSALFAS